VRLERLDRRYGDVVAVKDVTLSVAPGEFVTLLGPSGSGKTTTLMMIAGFETPDAGSISIDGLDITRLPPHRRNLGVIFQSYALFPHMTVEENIAYPLRMQRRPRAEISQRVRQALAMVQLQGLGQRFPSQLSGGQQQRVAIARALVFDPPVLLLDEPLGALDKKLRQHLQGELRALHQVSGKTMIYVTHDQEEALAMSDRVAIMKDGVIRQVGTPMEVYQRPTDLFVATFVGESNLLPVQLAVVGSAEYAVTRSGTRVPVSREVPRAAGGEWVLCIRPEKVRLRGIQDGGTSSGAAISGRIVDRTFVGDATYLRFQTDGDEELLIKELNQGPQVAAGGGERAVATWEQDDAILLRSHDGEDEGADSLR
jgi:putative spermidine/putrescine transport system ATP-binding protein